MSQNMSCPVFSNDSGASNPILTTTTHPASRPSIPSTSPANTIVLTFCERGDVGKLDNSAILGDWSEWLSRRPTRDDLNVSRVESLCV
jgi:hypothetical protein